MPIQFIAYIQLKINIFMSTTTTCAEQAVSKESMLRTSALGDDDEMRPEEASMRHCLHYLCVSNM